MSASPVALRPAAPAPDVHLKNVSRHWGGRAVVKDISLRWGAGERVALIGPSGAGKSTLIRLIAGALRPTAGVIEVNGQAMATFSWRAMQAHRSMCRIVEQQSLLVPQATVHSNVLSGLLSTWPWHRALLAALLPIEVERVAAVLQLLDLAAFQWRKAGELSGGQMQRVAIAQALIAQPRLLLADEPTASLDPSNAKAITQLIVEQARSRQMSLVFCTHWFGIVRSDCTRVVGLRAGEVMFDCGPDQVSDLHLAQLYAGSNERL